MGLTIICAPFVSPALRKFCLPYIPATNEQIKNVLIALKGKHGTIIDLGSGDGRIVLGKYSNTFSLVYINIDGVIAETAKNNFISHGVELNPWLVLYSKLNAFKNGYKSKTAFFCRDLWKFSIAKYDNVVIFGVEQMVRNIC